MLTVLLWSIYFCGHSLLASTTVKSYIYAIAPPFRRYYRITYNLLASAGLILLIYQTWSTAGTTLLEHPVFYPIGALLVLVGSILIVLSARSFNNREFLGIQQLKGEVSKPVLVQTGMYRMVRHPLYFSTIVLFTGVFFCFPHPQIGYICLTVFGYLIIGSRLEERKLEAEFGADYVAYKGKVKGLIPYIF